MSSVVVEYPESLPAPTTGSVTITERRKGSTIGGRKNFRTFQRDRHGQRTIAFTFTPAQAAIFREWWAEWLKVGGGWFAAKWPLPWTRDLSVFRFQDPPQWALLGGTLTGQGYWRVTATVEIRGRGMLPTMEVLYLTSVMYPIVVIDGITTTTGMHDINAREMPSVNIAPDSVASNITAFISARLPKHDIDYVEAIGSTITVVITARLPIVAVKYPKEAITSQIAAALTAKNTLITYKMPADRIQTTVGVVINAV